MEPFIVLALVALALVLFALERVPVEATSLLLIALLALTGTLTPTEALSGLSDETVVFIFTLLAMTQGLVATGVMQIVGRRAAFVQRFGERSYLASLLVTVTAFSSLASNTAVTAAFLPVASATASRARIPRSRVLLPMAYASMLGGTIFLYGTSTNLLVSEAMTRFGMEPLGFAELTPVGLPAAALALLLLIVASRYVTPDRQDVRTGPPVDRRVFITEAVIPPGSRLVGKPLNEIASSLDLDVIGMVHGGEWTRAPSDRPVRAGDRLVIRGGRRTILRLKDLRSMALEPELQIASPPDAVLAEVFVPPHSPLVGRSIRDGRITERFGLVVLAIHRHPRVHRGHVPSFETESISTIPLATGDVLLVSATQRRLRELAGGDFLTVLGGIHYRGPRYRKALLALLLFTASLATAASGLLPAALAGLLGLLAMLATRCLDVHEAFRIEWRILLLIGALLALGSAMEKSGAGALLARGLLPLADILGPRGLLLLVMLVTVFLSAPMSNQAAALVVLPVAVSVARMLDLDPRPFAVATALAASCSFMTPLEPSAALVYGPGHYRFADFLRAGTPLTLLLLGLFALLIPEVWPLRPGR